VSANGILLMISAPKSEIVPRQSNGVSDQHDILVRVASENSLSLQPRDFALLRGLFESRVMTSAHISSLYFDGKKEMAKKRLQKLKSAGLISERRRKIQEPAVLFLTAKGFKLLETEGVLSDYPDFPRSALERRAQVSEITLRHELEVMDVKAAFHKAVEQMPNLALVEFTTWPILNEFAAVRPGYGGKEVAVRPDGFIRILEMKGERPINEYAFYLELDRSTKTQGVLAKQAGCYLSHFQSGGFAVQNGAPRSAFKDYPFRVLFVMKNPERRNNTAAELLQGTPPILTQVCLSTFDEVTANPLDPIWIRPVDYRVVTVGTPYDPARRRQTWGYKRQVERELLVEQSIQKSSLLD